jgi:uncharacterized protein involved in exopolysaccharide biosynthesis
VQPPYRDDADDGPAIGLADLLTWLGESKLLIAIVTLAAALVALVVALLLPPIYTARTTLLAPNSQQPSGSAAALAALGSLGSLGGLGGSLTAKSPDELYVALLKSDSVQRNLAQRFKLQEHYDVESYEALRKLLPSYIRVASDKKSGVISVEVDDKDPRFAAELANAHETEVTKLLGRLAVSEAQLRRAFFEKQLLDTKENLIRAEQGLREVQEKSNGSAVDMPVGRIPEAAIEYVRARRELKIQETLLESMIRQFEIAKLDEAKEGPALQQVDVALPPDRKSKPSRALIVLASALLAFLLVSMWVVVRRYLALVRATDPQSAATWNAMARAWSLRRS